MPFKHRKNNGEIGVLNNCLTVGELLFLLEREVRKDKSILNKAIQISDDEEGNGYHGVYFAPTVLPAEVKSILAGGYHPKDEDLDDVAKNCIIIG